MGGHRYNMHVLSAERRFMLLLSGALLLMVALSVVTDSGSRRVNAAPLSSLSAKLASPPETAAVSISRRPASRAPRPFLEPLLAAPFIERFPRLAGAVAPPPRTDIGDALIVSYYGNPNSAKMGILGEAQPEAVADLLEKHAATYDRLNGETPVVPALHLVYAVAQPHPAENGSYLYYADDDVVLEYVALAEERGMLLFLDIQVGRSTAEAEVRKVLPYLRFPQVHLALDPEFAVRPGQVPGEVIGSLSAGDINRAQALMQEFVERERLGSKLLIVHQFIDSMVLDGAEIKRYPDVELVIDMDGIGPAGVKAAIYRRYAARSYAARPAIKLFFQQDTGLMSEQDVLDLEPPPAIVIYQ